MAALQYAIDVIEQDHALWLARQALANGVQWLEAGHVLIKAAGVGVVSKLKSLSPEGVIVADMKTMDMGAEEVKLAAAAGADVVMVCGAASDGTIQAAVDAAGKSGVRITASLMGIPRPILPSQTAEPTGSRLHPCPPGDRRCIRLV